MSEPTERRDERESPAKKITRLSVWNTCREILGNRFLTDTHLVLLGVRAGDVSVLKGMGVAARNIAGVDEDKHALDASKYKFPDVKCIRGDVADVGKTLKKGGRKISCAYLDFCAHVSDETIDKIVEVSSCVEPKGVLACAMFGGREHGEWAEKINGLHGKVNIRCNNMAFTIRARVISEALWMKDRSLSPHSFFYYVGHNMSRAGKPMIVCVYTKTERQVTRRRLQHHIQQARYKFIQATHLDLGALAVELEDREGPAHLLLNTTPGSVYAWKAHYTRGTYDE